jgi:hypothetical protein
VGKPIQVPQGRPSPQAHSKAPKELPDELTSSNYKPHFIITKKSQARDDRGISPSNNDGRALCQRHSWQHPSRVAWPSQPCSGRHAPPAPETGHRKWFWEGPGFSRAATIPIEMGFIVCVRTDVLAIRWNEELENAAPEGRTNLAQRFSAGKSGKNDLSPGGTTQFSRTHFSP